MEEILSSIRRVMAREDAETGNNPRTRSRAASADPFAAETGSAAAEAESLDAVSAPDDTEIHMETSEEEVLELTDATAETASGQASPELANGATEEVLLSEERVAASRQTLTQLAEMVKPAPRPDMAIETVSLDAMVREALKPMLKEWLDQNLPAIVEEMVAREIQRISGRAY